MTTGLCILAMAWTAGCGDDGGTSGQIDQDASDGLNIDAGDDTASSGVTEDGVGGDAALTDTASAADTAVADTAPEADTAVAEDTTQPADTTVAEDTSEPADTTQPTDTTVAEDTSTGEECTGECPYASNGGIGIDLTLHDRTVQPPTLSGLASGSDYPIATYELTGVEIYQYNTFASFVSVSISDNFDANTGRGTNGTANFGDDLWAVFLNLDVTMALSAIGQNLDQEVDEEVYGGGCYTFSGNTIYSDLGYCAGGWPEGVDPPDEAEYSYDDGTYSLKLKLTFTKEFILAQVPAEYATLAGFAITGDLVLILSLEGVDG